MSIVYADGSICLDILQNRWSPTYDVSSILTSIQVRNNTESLSRFTTVCIIIIIVFCSNSSHKYASSFMCRPSKKLNMHFGILLYGIKKCIELMEHGEKFKIDLKLNYNVPFIKHVGTDIIIIIMMSWLISMIQYFYLSSSPVAARWTKPQQPSQQSGCSAVPGEQTRVWEACVCHCRTKLERQLTWQSRQLLSLLLSCVCCNFSGVPLNFFCPPQPFWF